MKNIISIAVALIPFSSIENAQGVVSLYGRVDSTIAKPIGADAISMQNGTGSRLGFRGVEDLGNGFSAFFVLEHRFNADTGAQTDSLRYFRQSYMGIESKEWGQLLLGRDYTAAYWETQVAADYFGNSSVANFTNIVTGGIGQVREDNQIKYSKRLGPVATVVQLSLDRNQGAGSLSDYPHRPKSLAITYREGPLRASWGYENPGNERDVWNAATLSYEFKKWTLHGLLGTGKTKEGFKRKSLLLSSSIQLSPHGQLLFNYGRLKQDTNTSALNSRIGLGYYHSLSKRTTLYVDFAHDDKVAHEKWGYDIGLRHSF